MSRVLQSEKNRDDSLLSCFAGVDFDTERGMARISTSRLAPISMESIQKQLTRIGLNRMSRPHFEALQVRCGEHETHQSSIDFARYQTLQLGTTHLVRVDSASSCPYSLRLLVTCVVAAMTEQRASELLRCIQAEISRRLANSPHPASGLSLSSEEWSALWCGAQAVLKGVIDELR